MVLVDKWGRPLLNLRIGITKRCNLRCNYCHMEGEEKLKDNSSREMSVDEIVRIVRIAAELGISKVKLTGGEPLMRKDVVQVCKGIADLTGVTDVAMTTNGTLLPPIAEQLHANGLKRVNVSLPTLDGESYKKLTGGTVEAALEGVKAAVKAGFSPVKLNVLVLKCINEYDFSKMLDFAREMGVVLQLIELEPINISRSYYASNHESLDKYENLLKQKSIRVETRQFMQNRKIYHLPDLKVEVIRPSENTEFCMHCTRLRVTSDGKLKPCLMTNDGLVDILTPMREGASDKDLVKLFELINREREPYNKNHNQPTYCPASAKG